MSRKTWVTWGLVAVLFSLPALGGEIVHFTNGTTMEAESHSIEDGVIRLSLGGDSFMEFPVDRIEKIETANGEVAPLTDGQANQMVPTPKAAIQHGSAPRRGSRDGIANYEPSEHYDVDDKGMAVYRPYISGAPNKQKLAATGRRELNNARRSAGVEGATRRGGRYVLPPKSTVAKRTRTPVSIERKKN